MGFSSHRSSRGCFKPRRFWCKLLIAVVFSSFWLTLISCYYFVHNQDHDFDESSVNSRRYLAGLAPSRLVQQAGILLGVAPGAETPHVKETGVRGRQSGRRAKRIEEKYAVEVDVQVFPSCDNDTEKYFNVPGAMTGGFKIRRFTGRKLVPYVSVYPSDGTINLTSNQTNKNGNTIIARKVVKKLREQLHIAANGSVFVSGDIVHVERMSLPAGLAFGGRLFLLEMVSDHHDVHKYHHHNEYVLESGLLTGLCRPDGYVINPNSKIYVIFTVKNLGEWIVRMIKEFEQLKDHTGDENFELIVADFNSSDIDLLEIANLSKRSFTIRVVKMSGSYNKVSGIVAATELIQNPNDIIFLCDLHLEIPTTFLNDIRKHVIPSKMVFAPVIGKLDQGTALGDPQEWLTQKETAQFKLGKQWKDTKNMQSGQWDTNGFGLIAMTKGDWDMIGGINTKEFSGDQWGGEDWEMIDRIVESGLFINRWRVPGLLHHYHNKTGMWPGGRYQLMAGGSQIKEDNNTRT